MVETIHLLDNECQYLINKDPKLAAVMRAVGDISYSHNSDSFETIVYQIIEQMLSSKVAKVLYGHLLDICNNKITPEEILRHSIDELHSTGISINKSKYILGFAESVYSGKINFNELSTFSDSDVIKKLTSIKGIGNWTAKMYLLFVLNRPDILPYEDVAFLQSYKWLFNTNKTDPASVMKKCQKWSPYSSIASRYMYKALDTGLTKMSISDLIELYG